jgi:hypothetical protein
MFITLTDVFNPRLPHAIHVRAADIQYVRQRSVLQVGGEIRPYSVIHLTYAQLEVAESADHILGLIGSRGEPRAADRHLFTLAADELFNLGAKPDLVAQLRAAAEHWRGAGGDAVPSETLVNALDDRDKWKAACTEWSNKTDWVREQQDSFPFQTLGLHRADVMKKEIDRLRAEKELWRAAAGLSRDQIQRIADSMLETPARVQAFMAKVDAVLVLGEKK